MKKVEPMRTFLDVADLHATRLEKALVHIKILLPFTPETLQKLSDENLGYLELLTSRFAKLQDWIGGKLFPQLLNLLQESNETQTQLDRLHRLEKIGFLPSAQAWTAMRAVRNAISHEYPDEPQLMCDALHKVVLKSEELLSYWAQLKTKIKALG